MSADTPPPVEQVVVIPAPLESVWERWTTDTGLTMFFARAVNVELRVGGAYEILFFPDNPPGSRGAEGLRLMALEPPHRLAFDWDAPPTWPAQRGQRTMVEVRLATHGDGTTVTLRHSGWGDSEEWAEVRSYFDGAWEKVLARLKYSYEVGPVDWDSPPPELMYAGGAQGA
jgi:uncharacterized protein YndB with AHSA1/START domain